MTFLTRSVSMTRVLITVAAISVFAAVACPDLHAGSVALPFYTGEHATVTRNYLNPTIEKIALPDDGPVVGYPGKVPPSVAPLSLDTRLVEFSTLAGVYHVELPDGLEVFSEITTGSGALFRVPPMTAVDHALYIGFKNGGGYNSGIFIAAESDTVVTLLETGESFPLSKDQGVIVATPLGPTATLINQLGTGKFYTFLYINRQNSGSVWYVPAR